jgi:hypothetical protein
MLLASVLWVVGLLEITLMYAYVWCIYICTCICTCTCAYIYIRVYVQIICNSFIRISFGWFSRYIFQLFPVLFTSAYQPNTDNSRTLIRIQDLLFWIKPTFPLIRWLVSRWNLIREWLDRSGQLLMVLFTFQILKHQRYCLINEPLVVLMINIVCRWYGQKWWDNWWIYFGDKNCFTLLIDIIECLRGKKACTFICSVREVFHICSWLKNIIKQSKRVLVEWW